MPQLNQLHVESEAADGTKFKAVLNVYVSKEGAFSVCLDERLLAIAERLSNKPCWQGSVRLDSSRNVWKVCTRKLAEAEAFLQACASDFTACETISERVIVYGHVLNVAFWLDEHGEIQTNGCYPRGGQRDGHWYRTDTLSSKHFPYYTVGLGAAVYNKTTYKRQSGDTTTYARVRGNDSLDIKVDAEIEALNSFTGLSIDPDRGEYRQMPYTREAAQFFYRMLISLCALGLEMDRFFEDDKRLLGAIHSGRLIGFSEPTASIEKKKPCSQPCSAQAAAGLTRPTSSPKKSPASKRSLTLPASVGGSQKAWTSS